MNRGFRPAIMDWRSPRRQFRFTPIHRIMIALVAIIIGLTALSVWAKYGNAETKLQYPQHHAEKHDYWHPAWSTETVNTDNVQGRPGRNVTIMR